MHSPVVQTWCPVLPWADRLIPALPRAPGLLCPSQPSQGPNLPGGTLQSQMGGLPLPWGSTTFCGWGAGSSAGSRTGSGAGSSECLCLYGYGGDREKVPPQLLFPVDEVTRLQRLSSAEGESVPARPRHHVQPLTAPRSPPQCSQLPAAPPAQQPPCPALMLLLLPPNKGVGCGTCTVWSPTTLHGHNCCSLGISSHGWNLPKPAQVAQRWCRRSGL